jgi:hypothetical protein
VKPQVPAKSGNKDAELEFVQRKSHHLLVLQRGDRRPEVWEPMSLMMIQGRSCCSWANRHQIYGQSSVPKRGLREVKQRINGAGLARPRVDCSVSRLWDQLVVRRTSHKRGRAARDCEPFSQDWSTIGAGSVSSRLRLKPRTCSHKEQQMP